MKKIYLSIYLFFILGSRQRRIYDVLVHPQNGSENHYKKIEKLFEIVREFDSELLRFIVHNIWAIVFLDRKHSRGILYKEYNLVTTPVQENITPLFLASELVRFASFMASNVNNDFSGAKKAQLIFLIRYGTPEANSPAEYLNHVPNPRNPVNDLSSLKNAPILNSDCKYYGYDNTFRTI